MPLSTYIKEGEEEAGGQEGRAIGGVQLGFPILVGVSFLFQEGERGKEEEREKERGGRRPLLVQLGLPFGRGWPPFPSSLSPPSFLSYSYLEGLLLLLGKGGILLPEGVGLP